MKKNLNTGILAAAGLAIILTVSGGVKLGDKPKAKIHKDSFEVGQILSQLTKGERRYVRHLMTANGMSNLAKAGTLQHLNMKPRTVSDVKLLDGIDLEAAA